MADRGDALLRPLQDHGLEGGEAFGEVFLGLLREAELARRAFMQPPGIGQAAEIEMRKLLDQLGGAAADIATAHLPFAV